MLDLFPITLYIQYFLSPCIFSATSTCTSVRVERRNSSLLCYYKSLLLFLVINLWKNVLNLFSITLYIQRDSIRLYILRDETAHYYVITNLCYCLLLYSCEKTCWIYFLSPCIFGATLTRLTHRDPEESAENVNRCHSTFEQENANVLNTNSEAMNQR